MTDTLQRASIRDESDCRTAAGFLSQGEPVGSYIRGVCGIWVDGDNHSAIETAYAMKGEKRERRPFGIIVSAASLSEMIDADRISPETHRLFLDPDCLAKRLGSLCFIRYPVRESEASSLPEAVLSEGTDGRPWLQSWMPEGCEATRIWQRELRAHDIDLPIATSMNTSGTPELVDQEEGAGFCERHGIPIFLEDPQPPGVAQGSFPILVVDEEGVAVIREGHFTAFLFDFLLAEWDVDRTEVQQARHSVVKTHSRQEASNMAPEDLRVEMIRALDGINDA